MSDIRYYIKHPNGRERVEAKTDKEAMAIFDGHWTSKANWISGKKRELVKETREIIASSPLEIN